MRKSFWELATIFGGFRKEMLAIDYLFNGLEFRSDTALRSLTIKKFINNYYFRSWACRNSITYTSIEDLMEDLGVNFFHSGSSGAKFDFSLDEFLMYMETVYNLVSINIKADHSIIETVLQIKHNIKIDCERIGLEIRKIGDEKYIIVEKDAAATAVADKYADVDLAFSHKVIEYNHFLLRGDIERKREILLAIGQKFEPIRRRLEDGPFKSVSEDARTLLNNLNIRHDNISPEDKSHYNAVVDQMPNGNLEEWYDKTYNILLLALLADDFSALHKEVGALKAQIGSK